MFRKKLLTLRPDPFGKARFNPAFRIKPLGQDLRQTEEWGEFLRSCGWIVEKIGNTSCFIKKIPLTPLSIMKVQRFKGGLNQKKFNKLKRRHRVVYSIFEPLVNTIKCRQIDAYLPTKTIVIDLKKTKEDLWRDLSENTKRILKRQDKIVVKKMTAISFAREWRRARRIYAWKTAKLDKLAQAFGDKMELLGSEKDKRWLSGILILKSADSAFYFQTWTNKEGRKLGAHYKLVWETILSAKAEGLCCFDFEGVNDSRFARKSWRGFSEFKRKFGGKEVIFPGCFGEWFYQANNGF